MSERLSRGGVARVWHGSRSICVEVPLDAN